MKGPLHVIRRRRVERPADEADATQAATEAPATAQPAADPGPAAASHATSQAPPGGSGSTAPGGSGSTPPAGSVPGAGAHAPSGDTPSADAADAPATAQTNVPAGQEPVPDRPSFRQRGRLRRRLRYLRRVRELGFRDLGGLVFDQHRFSNVNEELVRGKLAALAAVDAELRTLEHALDDRRPITELREPGISVCPRCGALHGSEARFCPSCGVAVHGALAISEVGEAVALPVSEPGTTPQPAGGVAPVPTGPTPLWAAPATRQEAAETASAAAEPEAEPQPASTEVAEREAAKAQDETTPITEQPTEIMRPATGAQAAAAAERERDATAAGERDATAERERHAPPAGGYADQAAEREREAPADGQAPAADGVPGAVAQPTGERSEP
jgi:hypothetical protein